MWGVDNLREIFGSKDNQTIRLGGKEYECLFLSGKQDENGQRPYFVKIGTKYLEGFDTGAGYPQTIMRQMMARSQETGQTQIGDINSRVVIIGHDTTAEQVQRIFNAGYRSAEQAVDAFFSPKPAEVNPGITPVL